MRASNAEKAASRKRIVASAARLLRQRGLDRVSVADLMQEAGLTHGGFYKHFGSKDALVATALDAAFDEFARLLEGDGDAEAEVRSFCDLYLSQAHVEHPEIGCPVAALGPEIARGPETIRKALSRGIRRIVDGLCRPLRGGPAQRRRQAIREFSRMVGAVVIARASDPELRREVLKANQATPLAQVR